MRNGRDVRRHQGDYSVHTVTRAMINERERERESERVSEIM